MTTLDELLAIHDIEQLKYRYMRALDTQQWALMETCFTADAHVWYNDGQYSHAGRDNIIKWFREHCWPGYLSSHIAVHPEIRLLSPLAAEGTWRMQDIVNYLEAKPSRHIEGGDEHTGAGYYYDEYRKEGAEWKIASTGFVRIFHVVKSAASTAARQLRAAPARGVKKTS